MQNIDKTTIIKIAKVLSAINLNDKYIQVISNNNIDAVKDFELINIKKD